MFRAEPQSSDEERLCPDSSRILSLFDKFSFKKLWCLENNHYLCPQTDRFLCESEECSNNF